MKKIFLPIILLLMFALTACGNTDDKKTEPKKEEPKTFTYESQTGPVEVPTKPKRVIVLNSYAGNVMALGVNLVGVDAWSKSNPLYTDLKNVEEVSEENIEKILELDPDLIIGLDNLKNVKQLKEIAPTVVYSFGKLSYLDQHIEIGKLLNKEDEATKWVEDFKNRAADAGKDIKAKIGEDATVSVVKNWSKQLYIYGDNWAHGTEILYQEMKLKMPEKVVADVLKPGYFALSLEVLPDYAGDYMIFCEDNGKKSEFFETETFKNMTSAKNGHVFLADSNIFLFNDPISLDYELDFIKKNFLKK